MDFVWKLCEKDFKQSMYNKMSKCIKDLYDYELVENCCRCKNILL